MVETREVRRRRMEEVKTSLLNVQHSTKTHSFTGITIGTLNIIDDPGNRLEMACNRLTRHGIDIAIFTETKLNEFHPASAYGYSIVATKCKN